MFKTLASASTLALMLGGAASAEVLVWKADLDQAQSVVRESEAQGAMATASGTLDTESKELTYTVTATDLSGPVTAMHFHAPAIAGQQASVVADLGPNGLELPASGIVIVTDSMIAEIKNGIWYLNVHTAANPDGEVRGQVEVQ